MLMATAISITGWLLVWALGDFLCLLASFSFLVEFLVNSVVVDKKFFLKNGDGRSLC